MVSAHGHHTRTPLALTAYMEAVVRRCVLFEMATGSPPYVAGNQVALAHKICNEPPPALPTTCSPALRALVQGALHKDSVKRPTMLEFFQVATSCCVGPLRNISLCDPNNFAAI